MKDFELDFGSLDALASADAYCETCLNFGVVANYLGSGTPAKVVFHADEDCVAFTPKIYSGSSEANCTTAYLIGREISILAGEVYEMPLPFDLLQYVRVGGVGTSGAISAWIEVGTGRN